MAILSKNTKIGNKKPLLIADNIKSKNIDLNDYTSEGNYIFNNLETTINFPNGYNWINENASHLQVFIFDNNNSSKVMQILTRYNCNNLFIRNSYINELNETVWTKWVIAGESVGLSHRNFALPSKNNIPADIRAGDICFIWNQFDSSHTTDDFKAANFTNMPISDDIDTADTEYFGLVKGTTDGLISGDMEVAKTPSGTKIFFNKI